MGAEAKIPKEQNGNESASQKAAYEEARHYWGDLIKDDRCGSPLFDRLLLGIAEVISKKFEPNDTPPDLHNDLTDLTPSQIAAFYRTVGGNGSYDDLFLETPSTSIAFIYRSLGAFHSLQPALNADGYGNPTVPALKKKGFVMWQTIQLLLGPEEHVPFLQKAVANFDVLDPETGSVFPKILPKECFPDRPDEKMECWYEGVAARLQQEAAEAEGGNATRSSMQDERLPRTSSEFSGESADERHGAAKYFEDPLYRKSKPSRPTFIRQFSKQPRQYVEEHGRLVANVRHLLNPFSKRRSVPSARYQDDSFSDEDATPIAPAPPRYPSHKRPHPPRREDSLTTSDSDSDSDHPPSRRRTPVLRRQRSHEPPTSPREYFPAYYEERRYSHEPLPENRKQDGPPPLYGPTKSPLFATHVAQAERNYYNHRPTMAPRTSYRGPNGRYSGTLSPGREIVDPPYVREYEPGSGSNRSARRRSVDEYTRDRDRDRDRDSTRTRSHDRDHNWDKRDRSWDRNRDRERDRDRDRERDRERDRDRDRRTHRYVSGVQDGVGGRRYPVLEQPWR